VGAQPRPTQPKYPTFSTFSITIGLASVIYKRQGGTWLGYARLDRIGQSSVGEGLGIGIGYGRERAEYSRLESHIPHFHE